MNRQRKQHRLYGMAMFWLIVLAVVGFGQRWLRRTMETPAAGRPTMGASEFPTEQTRD